MSQWVKLPSGRFVNLALVIEANYVGAMGVPELNDVWHDTIVLRIGDDALEYRDDDADALMHYFELNSYAVR